MKHQDQLNELAQKVSDYIVRNNVDMTKTTVLEATEMYFKSMRDFYAAVDNNREAFNHMIFDMVKA